jgi:hypothetical protein
MTDDNRIDPFDDLFEPFDLESSAIEDLPDDAPLPPRAPATPTQADAVQLIDCPSCGTANPAHNRHCEECGARIGQSPLPMAPPPMIRATPGGRALGVLAAVVLVVALVSVLFNAFRGDGGDAEATSTSTSTTTAAVEAIELRPTEATASTELNANFGAENLIDNDATTSWNDKSLRGQDAVLTFRFAQPVQISYIEIQNVQDQERFARNYRIRGYAIGVDDLAIELTGRLEDSNDPQQIKIASLETTRLEFRVTSTYPAQSADGQPPFNELAVEDIRFFGTTP